RAVPAERAHVVPALQRSGAALRQLDGVGRKAGDDPVDERFGHRRVGIFDEEDQLARGGGRARPAQRRGGAAAAGRARRNGTIGGKGRALDGQGGLAEAEPLRGDLALVVGRSGGFHPACLGTAAAATIEQTPDGKEQAQRRRGGGAGRGRAARRARL